MSERMSPEELAKYIGMDLNSPTAKKFRAALIAERAEVERLEKEKLEAAEFIAHLNQRNTRKIGIIHRLRTALHLIVEDSYTPEEMQATAKEALSGSQAEKQGSAA